MMVVYGTQIVYKMKSITEKSCFTQISYLVSKTDLFS